MVEHLPVVTIGRRAEAGKHLLASPKMLELRGVELVETDRGGDITFHGAGQLVVYPIIDLNAYNMNLHSYMRLLEEVVIRVRWRSFGVEGKRSEGATGVWVNDIRSGREDGLAKVCAMGVKLRRWVTLHGLALNVSTDLSYFELINPCGLGRPVTSMREILGERCPTMGEVKGVMVREFERGFEGLGVHVGVEDGFGGGVGLDVVDGERGSEFGGGVGEKVAGGGDDDGVVGDLFAVAIQCELHALIGGKETVGEYDDRIV